ncbi:hypothetical protein [Francisella philomiragia]|uniref:hypothetical protein n=1 Tax=Francisella philomiragia TaxID=28110 RepID=UPI0022440D49|nr:hypothetical protein [Francisella philomiragia]
MASVKFLEKQLTLGDSPLVYENIKELKSDFKEIQELSGISLSYKSHIDISQEYVFFYFQLGKPSNTYTDKVFNKKEKVEKDNLHTKDEYGLTEQLFCLYHFKKNTFYINKNDKCDFFKEYLQNKIDSPETIIIKNIICQEKLEQTFKEINSIELISKIDLISNERITEFTKNFFGFAEAESISIKVKFSGKINKKKLSTFKKENENTEKLIIKGHDDKGINTTINNDKINRSLSVIISDRDINNGFKDFNKVKDCLLEVINKNESLHI